MSVTPAREPWGRSAWRAALGQPGFRLGGALTLAALVATLAAFTRFVSWVEDRPGVVLDDPLLSHLAPRDFNLPTFALIYFSLALTLALLVPRPARLLLAVRTYVLVVLVRMLLMWLTPLDPPLGIIPLSDPLVEGLGPGRALTRDLFFSGHVATGFALFLVCPGALPRTLLLLATAAVGALTLFQHVHYAVDVAAAPLIAFTCWQAARRIPGTPPVHCPSSPGSSTG